MHIAGQSCGLAPRLGTAAVVLMMDWLFALLPQEGILPMPGGELGPTLSQAREWVAVSEKSSEPSSEAWGDPVGLGLCGGQWLRGSPWLELKHSLPLRGFGAGATTPRW